MNSKFRPILPATSTAAGSASGGGNERDPTKPTNLLVPRAKRSPVYTACNHCRKRKIKCDGKTPSCTRCINKKLACEYDIEPDVSRQVSMRRKYEVMQDEAASLRELYRYLHEQSKDEALRILERIRSTPDPIEVLHHIKERGLLLAGVQSAIQSHVLSTRARTLDEEALHESPFKIRAGPWTSVATDGIVSELISGFFTHNQPFYFCFVEKHLLLADLTTKEPQRATWCSPLLVNAICALQSYTSKRAKQWNKAQNIELDHAFYQEARRLFDSECGKATIPSVQALLIMFIYSAGRGRDRAGMMYRYTAYELLKRLRLDSWYHKLDETPTDGSFAEQMAISRVLWGIFCFESSAAFAYLKPSLLPPPSIPKLFIRDTSQIGRTEDVEGNPLPEDSPVAPITAGILYPMCEISEILHEVMSMYESRRGILGSDRDLERRCALYQRIVSWTATLPTCFQTEGNFTPETYYLSTLKDMAIIGLFRPLDHDLALQLPGGVFTAGQMCITACQQDVDGLSEYESRYRFDEYSVYATYPMYNASLTLVSRLHDARTARAFTEVCRLLVGCIHDIPFTAYLMKALWTLAEKLHQTLPERSIQYFRAVQDVRTEVDGDVPISFVLPQHDDMAEFLSEGSDGGFEESRFHMGNLLSKWTAMSLE